MVSKVMLALLAYSLTILLAVAIIVIGIRFFLAPRSAADGYGVPIQGSGAGAYLSAKGLRDLTYGVTGLVLLAVSGPRAVGWFLAAAAIVPVGDTFIVLRRGGSKEVAFGVHLATAAAMWVAAALLLAL